MKNNTKEENRIWCFVWLALAFYHDQAHLKAPLKVSDTIFVQTRRTFSQHKLNHDNENKKPFQNSRRESHETKKYAYEVAPTCHVITTKMTVISNPIHKNKSWFAKAS